MRISDWSSDVCSSDLVDTILTNVFQHTPEGTSFAVTVRDGGTPTVVVEDDGPGTPEPAPEERGVSAGGSTGLGLGIVRRDRKSVGEGKRVLVRVHQGGRRILKKKKNAENKRQK